MNVAAIIITIAGVAVLGEAVLRPHIRSSVLSVPILAVGFGYLAWRLPVGLPDLAVDDHLDVVEHVTEIAVVVSLMGVGLSLDNRLRPSAWSATTRLLVVALPISVALGALLGWVGMGLAPATALLLSSVLAPTDPVLASEVHAGPPGEGGEDAVRFSLTAEGGLNDGLAFPFVNAGVAAAAAAPGWATAWFLRDVVLEVSVGFVAGMVLGTALGWVIFRLPGFEPAAEAEGIVAIGGLLLVYGVTELLHGYGFFAVFLAATRIRSFEREHDYHKVMHDLIGDVERLLVLLILVLLGGAFASGVLDALTPAAAIVALLLVFPVRMLAGVVALLGVRITRRERLTIAFYGIRGVGSLYYLAYALGQAETPADDLLVATVCFAILASIVVHGVTASTAMAGLDRDRRQRRRRSVVDAQDAIEAGSSDDGAGRGAEDEADGPAVVFRPEVDGDQHAEPDRIDEG